MKPQTRLTQITTNRKVIQMADVSLAIARPFQRTKWKKLHGIYSYGTLHAAFLSRNEAEKYASDSFENEDEYVIVFDWVKVDA